MLQIAKLREAKLRDLAIGHSTYCLPYMERPVNYLKNEGQKINERQYQPHTSDQRCCYNYNATGHLSRNCPLRGRGAPVESQGRKSNCQAGAPKKLSVIVPEQATEEEQENAIETELEEVLEKAATITNALNPMEGNSKDHSGSIQGHTPTAEVLVEGQPVTTLLGTGSPMTVLSLNLIVNRCVTVNIHQGSYRYNQLPFGVASAPAVLQETMEKILQGLNMVVCYIDDILVIYKTDEEHLMNLEKVFAHLQEHGLRLKKSKCAVMSSSVEYLGYVIAAEGIKATPKKVEAISRAPKPNSKTELRSFHGLVNYYGKFILQLATITQPLNQLRQN